MATSQKTDSKNKFSFHTLSSKTKSWISIASSAVMMAVLALCFNNCSNDFALKEMVSDTLPSSFSVCKTRKFDVFYNKIHPFTSQHCSSCHGGRGPSNDPFASSNKLEAFDAFEFVGYETFKSYASNPTHAAGITGPARDPELEVIASAWEAVEGDSVCDSERPVQTTTLEPNKTIAKVMTANNTYKTITWNLSTETMNMGDFAGATFEIQVRATTPLGGRPTYYIRRPIIKTAAKAIEVKELMIFINGYSVDNGTTFRGIDMVVTANTTTTPLSVATLLMEPLSGTQATDTIAVSFAHLKKSDYVPPTPTPTPVPTPTPPPTPTPTPVDGAAVYGMKCATCHGALAVSTKANKTATDIMNALANVPQMAGVVVNQAEIDAIANALKMATPTPTPTPPPNGVTLYGTNCSACHGALAVSVKANKTAAQITTALSTIPQMQAISLTPAEISAIATALVK